jgi:predicted RNA-binding protein YlxR (DUF448 family)/ribosomal protein L30E
MRESSEPDVSARARPRRSATERIRERTCVGCRRVDAPERLIRLVLGPAGRVAPDLAGKAFGRGAWVHPSPGCLSKAAPRGLSRSLRSEITTSVTELWVSLRAAADRRIEGLVGAADRAGRLAVGSTAAREAFEAGRARLVLVATDARAAADAAWVYEAVRSGIGLAWGKKAALGRATRHDDVAVAAVLDDGIAQALAFAVGVAELPAPQSSTNVLADSSTEDG